MLEPREQFTERVTVRARPSQLRRLDVAARLAGISRSRIVREGSLKLARRVIESEAGEERGGEERREDPETEGIGRERSGR